MIDEPRNTLLDQELWRLIDQLSGAGIDAVVLKGIPFTYITHGGLRTRALSDNDLLVLPRDLEAAARIIERSGYRPHGQLSLEEALTFDYQYAYELIQAPEILVELHWSAFDHLFHPISPDAVWEHRTLYHHGARSCQVLAPSLCLLHLAAHAEHHAFGQPRILDDLARAWNLWGPRLDLGQFQRTAKELRLFHLFLYCVRALERLGWLTFPPPPWKSGRAERLLGWLPPEELLVAADYDYGRVLRGLVLLDTRQALWVLSRRLVPSPSYLTAAYGDRRSARLYLRYLTRLSKPVRALASRLGLTG